MIGQVRSCHQFGECALRSFSVAQQRQGHKGVTHVLCVNEHYSLLVVLFTERVFHGGTAVSGIRRDLLGFVDMPQSGIVKALENVVAYRRSQSLHRRPVRLGQRRAYDVGVADHDVSPVRVHRLPDVVEHHLVGVL